MQYTAQHGLKLTVQSIEKLLLKSTFIVVQYNIIIKHLIIVTNY